MKFYCDKCQAKYSIADEKVRGKVLKVRCKKCSHVITVREPRAPVGAGSRQPQQRPAAQSLPWYYALNGQTFGPYEKPVLMRMFESGEIGDACYVWNETFVEWLPARQVAEFVPALDRGSAIRPRNKTIGVSGALEAIKVDQIDVGRQQQLGATLDQDTSQASEEEIEEEGAVPGQMADRIDALRDRLKQHQRSPEGGQKNPFGGGAASPLAQAKPSLNLPGRHQEPPLTQKPLELESAPALTQDAQEEAHDTTSQMSMAEISGLIDAPAAGLGGGSTEAVEDLHIETSEASQELSPEEGDEILPALSSDLFSGLEPDDEPFLSDETREEIPAFIGAAPMPESTIDFSKLESRERNNDQLFVDTPAHLPNPDGDERFQASNSLLIQMDSIQKQGRGKRFTMIAALVVLFSVLGVVAVIAAQNAKKNAKPVEVSNTIYEDGKKELKFKRYSRAERAGLYELGEEEIIRADDPDAIVNDEPIEEEQPRTSGKPSSNKVVARNDVGRKPASASPNIRGIENILKDSSSRDDALKESSRSNGLNSRSGLNTNKDDGPRKIEVNAPERTSKKEWNAPELNSPGARRPSGVSIRAPSEPDSKDKPKAAKLGENGALSPAEAKKGFRKISRSVQTCHQRQVTRGIPVDAPKVFLTARIENDGSVSNIKIEPSSLESSEFASCLQSHRRAGRWKFSEFQGKALDIRHTYVLQ